jgi:hypothetical protein
VGLAGRGNSAIKRVAIVAGSGCDAGASGSSAINDANRCVAVAPNNPANLAASCQGSISSRASADRTLSNIPFLSSPSGGPRQLVLERGGDKGSAHRVRRVAAIEPECCGVFAGHTIDGVEVPIITWKSGWLCRLDGKVGSDEGPAVLRASAPPYYRAR